MLLHLLILVCTSRQHFNPFISCDLILNWESRCNLLKLIAVAATSSVVSGEPTAPRKTKDVVGVSSLDGPIDVAASIDTSLH